MKRIPLLWLVCGRLIGAPSGRYSDLGVSWSRQLSRRFILGVHEQGLWVGDEPFEIRGRDHLAMARRMKASNIGTVKAVMP